MDTIQEEDSVKAKNKFISTAPVPTAGGLLDNVSLLTTGASSLLQLTNEGNLTTSHHPLTATKDPQKQKLMNTSTPARTLPKETIMYGFDLSPVHSYEYKPSLAASFHDDESTNQVKQSLEQEKLEDALFDQKSKPAPNFMQAPLVSSPHQSRIGVLPEKILGDDTETMMSQVYSPQAKPKKSGRSKRAATPTKKRSSSASLYKQQSSVSGPTTPRKSSKRYAHIRGSGYGMVSPQIGNKARASTTASSPAPTFNALSHQNVSTSASHLFSTSNYAKFVRQPKKNLQEVESPIATFDQRTTVLKDSLATSTNDISIHKTGQSDMGTMRADAHEHSLRADDTEAQVKLQLLAMRYDALQDECAQLQEKNTQANRQNFVLSSKLHKFMDNPEERKDASVKDFSGSNEPDEPKKPQAEIEGLKAELLEQEHLIKGYQLENERMYNDLSKMKATSRENEAAMYQENLKLKSQLAALKEELAIKDNILKDKNRLILECNEGQTTRLNQSTQTHEDPNFPHQRLAPPCEVHLKEITDLRNKIQQLESCHVEATERDTDRLKQADGEVALLKSQVARMKKELLLKNNAKRESQLVQDLRRQIKEQQQILTKSRNADNVQKILRGDDEIKLWKDRAEKLERNLKEQEDNSAKSIQSLQRLFGDMKVEYEGRVDDLSVQLDLIKQHSRKYAAAKQYEEVVEELEQRNEGLRLEVESLRGNLIKDRKKYAAQMSAFKKRLKVADERAYHPGSFANKPPIELKEVSNMQNLKQTQLIEAKPEVKVDLTKDVEKWKGMYDDVKASQEALKKEHEAQLSNLTSSTQTSIGLLKTNLSKVEKEAEDTRMSLVACQAEKLSSQAREKALQLQIKSLLDELVETRNSSPNTAIRQLAALQSQVRLLSVQHHNREHKLNTALTGNADGYLRDQIDHLQAVIAEKNLLLSKFRCELDSILDVLEKQMMKQRAT